MHHEQGVQVRRGRLEARSKDSAAAPHVGNGQRGSNLDVLDAEEGPVAEGEEEDEQEVEELTGIGGEADRPAPSRVGGWGRGRLRSKMSK